MISKKLLRFYNPSSVLRKITIFAISIILSPFALILLLIRPLIDIRFVRIIDDRLGHLIVITEVFFRRLQLGKLPKKGITYIGIASKKPCNEQLLKMIGRSIPVIQAPSSIYKIFGALCFDKNLLSYLKIFNDLPARSNEYEEFSSGKPTLSFNAEEERKGTALLKSMGIRKKEWFICFHARDSSYLKKTLKDIDTSYHYYRDSDIINYIKAAEYIVEQGGCAVRMGSVIEKNLPSSIDKRIIDYASRHRTDFGDIYLPAKCKFFLGNGCGMGQVSQMFNVPVVWVNLIPLEFPPYSHTDMFIPKKIWSIKKKRLLTFSEILECGIGNFVPNPGTPDKHKDLGLKPIENTPEEILDLVEEINQRIDGTWKPHPGDEELQRRYRSLFGKDCICHGFPSRIGAKFLRENKILLR
jgi:putative glycosyltransferase (TIGR04372 family)